MADEIPQMKNDAGWAPLKVAIVGAGLVGSLAALNLARRQHEVHLYEYREDIRTAALVQGRSINLALSQRGRKALAEVGLEADVLATAIPMHGRMLHDTEGRTTVVLYDPCTKQCLYSVGRKHLNELLLNAGEKLPNIHYHFEHKLVSTNLHDGTMEFRVARNGYAKEQADLVIGCDGAFSAVRQQIVKAPGFNYSQQYIEHGYLELCIPAAVDGDFQMAPNYLHIWPRNSFMMIALPNQDKSFTVTLSMPFKVFEAIRTPAELLLFFRKHYADAIPLIGEAKLIEDFFKSKPQHLVSVKCNPYHSGKGLLLGDAAHAMVPYYGQGMNAGMEDCTLLMAIMSDRSLRLDEVLEQFTASRCHDAHAICDLAMYNYVEMRDLTKRWSFRCRKQLDTMLFRLMPSVWVPLYNSVSFTSMPYRQCIENRQWQDRLLKKVLIGSVLTALTFASAILYAQYLSR